MRLLGHLSSTAFVSIVLAVATPAQSVETIIRRLKSSKLNTVAWAAYDAKSRDAAKLVTELRRALSRVAKRPREARKHTAAAILDALVRLDGKPTSAELRPHLHDILTAPAIVLMARNPNAHEDLLLEIVGKGEKMGMRSIARQAAGYILVQSRSERLAEVALRGLHFTIAIGLRDPKSNESYGLGYFENSSSHRGRT